jgi:hypothetical protein
VLSVATTAIVLALAIGWTWSVANARNLPVSPESRVQGITALVASSLTSAHAPSAAYVTDAALNALADRALRQVRGASGKLQAVIQPAPAALPTDTLPPGASIEYRQGTSVAPTPKNPGVWNVLLSLGNSVRPVSNLNVITMLPFSAKQNGKIGLYFLGNWPSEHGKVGPAKAPAAAYASPSGFIQVTPQNADTPLSEHFTLRDFLTHDQPNAWPKYLVIQSKLVDKLELVLADLQAHGVDPRGVKVMSGFRTPQYNYTGGNTTGRANLSRHMFGDAADIYIDDNGDGQMDDLNHDGKISIDDSRVILSAVERVEAAHPELIGGAGVYTAASGHGPFIHIDTRGYRARWSGTSGG